MLADVEEAPVVLADGTNNTADASNSTATDDGSNSTASGDGDGTPAGGEGGSNNQALFITLGILGAAGVGLGIWCYTRKDDEKPQEEGRLMEGGQDDMYHKFMNSEFA